MLELKFNLTAKYVLDRSSCATIFCGGGEDSASFSEFGRGALEDDAGRVYSGYVWGGAVIIEGMTNLRTAGGDAMVAFEVIK